MKVISDCYLIEPGDSLEEIKYLIQMGCNVYATISPLENLRKLVYSRFGMKLSMMKFYHNGNNNYFGTKYYVDYDF